MDYNTKKEPIFKFKGKYGNIEYNVKCGTGKIGQKDQLFSIYEQLSTKKLDKKTTIGNICNSIEKELRINDMNKKNGNRWFSNIIEKKLI